MQIDLQLVQIAAFIFLQVFPYGTIVKDCAIVVSSLISIRSTKRLSAAVRHDGATLPRTASLRMSPAGSTVALVSAGAQGGPEHALEIIAGLLPGKYLRER